jgi:cell division ATPase FtsA
MPSSRVTERELGEVVRRAQRLALRQLGEVVGSSCEDQGTKLELLESSVTAVRIDGRGVTNPIGLYGERLAVTVFNVVLPAAYLRVAESVIGELGLEILKVTSCWQAVAAAAPEKRGICVDLGGTTTGVMLVHGNRALATASIPIGGRDFTTQLATSFELSDEDAERLKIAYSGGRLDPGVASRVGAALEPVLEGWIAELEGALVTLCGSEGLPSQFSLCGGASILPGVVEVLRSHTWFRRLKCSQHPEVRLIRPEKIRDVLDATGQLRGQQYACPMAIAGHFAGGGGTTSSWDSLLWAVKRPNTFVDGGNRS